MLPGMEELRAPEPTAPGTSPAAAHRPVARVAIDTRVPHLDRLFDYEVPAELEEQAQPGVRVRVSFHGRVQVAWLVERVETSAAGTSLRRILEVVSPLRLLTEQTWELVRAVAARMAGLDADVLRLAVPPRAARTEQAFLREHPGLLTGPQPPPAPPVAELDSELHSDPGPASTGPWGLYRGGAAFLAALGAQPEPGEPTPRAVAALAPSAGADWARLLAAACRAAVSAGRRALVIVPDATALDRLAAALAPLFDAERIARLSNDEGLSERAGAHLRARAGLADVVIGTRSAAFAPVPELGLLACFDDGDPNLTERQAPYAHARDVLLLRSAREEVPLLLCGYAVSAEAQRLVDTGWAVPLSPDREDLRRTSPLVVATSDSYQRARDPLAALARIPQRAHQAARRALEHGPVLVQVARTGYAPTLACQRCRTPARCPHCHGPLGLTRDSRSHAECRWCGRAAADWACPSCGNRTWRLSTVGALRTAEELGRAFPRVPVISSSGEHVRAQVPDRPALVVATPGAEPRVPGGYRAALLLDGDRMLQRDALRSAEDVLRRWANACALVRSRQEGGEVVVTAEQSSVLAALVRWDPSGWARRELAERRELGLPPAVRTAAITGPRTGVEAFLRALDPPSLGQAPALRVIDPIPLEPDGEDQELYRALVFMSYGIAPQVTAALRRVRAASSAAREHAPVQVRCDGSDVL